MVPKIQAVLLGSEGTSDEQRDLIERGLGARAFTWYGLSERVALGGECEKIRHIISCRIMDWLS